MHFQRDFHPHPGLTQEDEAAAAAAATEPLALFGLIRFHPELVGVCAGQN